ncbi:carboxylesterase/lipase family protein [Nocardioides kongjuensis]|uniref:Carboxylic ester hydrolase n=1 Tax=Nocardioides kongjuensis TaxID=349522 RepID=A0A852RX00_9ACTN|nr:para-nitrobenzyl esterase [Nocardioides kongjuensis]
MVETTLVTLAQGQVRGARRGDVTVWRGLPFAAPPVGDLRWKAPQPAPGWEGVRAADRFAPRARQEQGSALLPSFGAAETDADAPQSEDCLHLNVCAPAERDPEVALPVLVWFHGGGYAVGSGATFSGDGMALAREGCIVVTPNYRLGSLGMLRLDHLLGPEYADAANCALLDQVQALRWVRENIASFGGDPDRVTIGGISAGAKSAINLMATPAARGLFEAAVVHSGGDHVARPDQAAELAAELLRELGIDPADAAALLGLPADDILAAQERLGRGVRATWLWRPMVDGRILPATPTEALRSGAARGVRMIAGVTANEGGSYALAEPSANDLVPTRLAEIFGTDADDVIETYRTARPALPGRLVHQAILGDERYGVPTVRLLDAQSEHADTWRYVFEAPTPGVPPEQWGFHGADQTYLWDVGLADADPALVELGAAIRRTWGRFVAGADPAGAGLPDWPRYDATERATLVLDTEPRVEHDPRADERLLWHRAAWTPGSWWHLPERTDAPDPSHHDTLDQYSTEVRAS